MTEILHNHSPPPPSTSITCNNDNESFINSGTSNLCLRICTNREIGGEEGDEEGSVLAILVAILRKSLVGCKKLSGVEGEIMEIGWPTNVRHVAHVTFDRFNGFLGLPVEFEPEVPRRPPSASTRVFGVSTESMQLSFDSRGNCVPTILLMMQRRLYSQGGLQYEGIFRINPANGQEEYVREQLNNGLIPDNIDIHCLAALIKAWFRELPSGILDTLSPKQVMRAQSEDDCTHLVSLLPPTQAALLDWTINLMADVAQLEHLNKMNARNIAMVFAPNMTQMSDPLTALMYAVQVMNFLKTLIIKILREREDCIVEAGPTTQSEPSNEDRHHRNILKSVNLEANEISEQEKVCVAKEDQSNQDEPKTGNETHGHVPDNFPSENNFRATMHDGIEGEKRTQIRMRRTKTGQTSNSNNVKKGSRKHIPQPAFDANERNKEISTISYGHKELGEAWR